MNTEILVIVPNDIHIPFFWYWAIVDEGGGHVALIHGHDYWPGETKK